MDALTLGSIIVGRKNERDRMVLDLERCELDWTEVTLIFVEFARVGIVGMGSEEEEIDEALYGRTQTVEAIPILE